MVFAGMVRLSAALLACTICASAAEQPEGNPFEDWSRVMSLTPGRTVKVQPFRGAGAKAKGALVRADARSIVVLTEHREVQVLREDIRRVRMRRRGFGHAPWFGALAGFAVLALAASSVDDFAQPSASWAFGGLGAGLGALGGVAVREVGQGNLIYKARRPRR